MKSSLYKITVVVTLFMAFGFINLTLNNEAEVNKTATVALNEKTIKGQQINKLLEQLPKSVPITILERHASPVISVKWSPDNIHIATYSSYDNPVDNLIRIWNVGTGALINGIGSPKEIKDFAWSPDGKKIAMTHNAVDVLICNLENIFQVEREMESLSLEQLAFIELFFAEKPLAILTKRQQEILQDLPVQLKDSLMKQLDSNKEGIRANPLR